MGRPTWVLLHRTRRRDKLKKKRNQAVSCCRDEPGQRCVSVASHGCTNAERHLPVVFSDNWRAGEARLWQLMPRTHARRTTALTTYFGACRANIPLNCDVAIVGFVVRELEHVHGRRLPLGGRHQAGEMPRRAHDVRISVSGDERVLRVVFVRLQVQQNSGARRSQRVEVSEKQGATQLAIPMALSHTTAAPHAHTHRATYVPQGGTVRQRGSPTTPVNKARTHARTHARKPRIFVTMLTPPIMRLNPTQWTPNNRFAVANKRVGGGCGGGGGTLVVRSFNW